MCLGKWGVHNTLRVFIPELHHEDRSQFLSQQELEIFYQAGLRPAIERLEPEGANEWPATYADEMFRARGNNGQLNFQTKVLGDWLVPYLGDYIRSSLRDGGYAAWGEGLVFLHQIRGVKHANTHSIATGPARQALSDFMDQNELDPQLIHSPSPWWIDVGLEVDSKDGNCLAWRTDSHFYLVREFLNIAQRLADKITTPGSSKYTRDMTSHLTAVSGCRIAPGYVGRGALKVRYFQAYTTDKSHTYRLDRGRYAKFITGDSILKGRDQDYVQSIYTLYRNASRMGNQSLARLEARCHISQATELFLNLRPNRFEKVLRDSLVSFTPEEWW